jgi:CHASE3 domain sensor protein
MFFFMEKREALLNLKIIGWLLITFGLLGLVGTIVFWQTRDIVDDIMKVLFSISMLFFGFLILFSRKTFL